MEKDIIIQQILNEYNKNCKHQHECIQYSRGICRTLVAGTHGNAQHHTKTLVRELKKKSSTT